MSKHLGNEGIVKFGSTAIKVKTWSIDENANLVDSSDLADVWDTKVAGSNSWTAQIAASYDPTEASAASSLRAGSSVDVSLFAYGTTSGNQYFEGTGLIDKISRNGGRNALIEVQISLQGNGILNIATAP